MPLLKSHIWWILKSQGKGKDFEIPYLVDFEILYCFKSHANFYGIPQQTQELNLKSKSIPFQSIPAKRTHPKKVKQDEKGETKYVRLYIGFVTIQVIYMVLDFLLKQNSLNQKNCVK